MCRVSSAPVSPLCVLESGEGLGKAAVDLICSEGHMPERKGRAGDTPLWRERSSDDGRWREINNHLIFDLGPERKEHWGLPGMTKMTAFSHAT